MLLKIESIMTSIKNMLSLITLNSNSIPTVVGQHEQYFYKESKSISNNIDSTRYEYDNILYSSSLKTRRLSDLYENTKKYQI